MNLDPAVARSHVLISSVRIKEGREDAFLDAVRELTPGAEQEAGFLRFEIFRNRREPDRFVVVDVFRDAAAQQAHMATPQLRKFMERIGDLFAEPPQAQTYEVYAGIDLKS